jgi:hypothetical protein
MTTQPRSNAHVLRLGIPPHRAAAKLRGRSRASHSLRYFDGFGMWQLSFGLTPT